MSVVSSTPEPRIGPQRGTILVYIPQSVDFRDSVVLRSGNVLFVRERERDATAGERLHDSFPRTSVAERTASPQLSQKLSRSRANLKQFND